MDLFKPLSKTQNYSMLRYVMHLSFGVCSVLKIINVFNDVACDVFGVIKSMFIPQCHFWRVFGIKGNRHLFRRIKPCVFCLVQKEFRCVGFSAALYMSCGRHVT